MSFKKIFAWLTTYKDDEQDARKEKAKITSAFETDKNAGKILYKKEFLITDHKIKKYEFPGRYSHYKDLVLTDKGIYIIGAPSVEHFNYSDVSTAVYNNKPDFLLCTCIELLVQNKNLYVYSATNPLWGGHLNTFVELDMKKELEKDFSDVHKILESQGYNKA